MEAKAKAGDEDLSMEEILHSIRKIIADDGEETTAAPATNGNAMGSDVLELTDMLEEPAPVAAAPQPAGDVLSAIDQVLVAEPALPPVAAPVAMAEPAPAITANNQAYIDSLLSKEAANAASNALKKAIPMDIPIQTTPSTSFRSGTTVEDLVMESLKPMLKAWLDANLAHIVERIVEREVRKLSH